MSNINVLLYLVDYVFIVADVVLKGHNRFPWVTLGVYAAAGGFTIFMTSHSQRIPAEKQLFCSVCQIILPFSIVISHLVFGNTSSFPEAT